MSAAETDAAERASLVAGLRALADDLERGNAPLPTHPPKVQWLIFGDDVDQKAIAAEVVREIGGKWDKGKYQGGDLFDFTRDYGGGVIASVVVDRPQVCTRRVVGTETVTLPAIDAKPERTEDREIVEWDCSPLLAEAVSRG